MADAGPRKEDSADGNSRLTSTTGLLLLLLLAVEGVTVLRVRQLITLHLYLGLVLLGPVLLKSASATWRFGRYYTGSPAYVRKGPPHPVLRVLGPVVILSSLVLLGSGVALVPARPGRGGLLLLTHKASFVVWFGVMTVHVLGHLRETVLDSLHELRSDPEEAVRGRTLRLLLIAAALAAGVATATALMPTAAPWTSDTRPSHQDSGHDG